MKTPEFLRRLMSSPEYMDKNSKVYAMADKYLNLLYPGTVQLDATGRMTEPEYDMTLQQFNQAQAELDAALEEAKQEAEEEYAEAGQEIDVEDYVELEETIDVRVLMPLGTIENKQLEVYTLDLPEGDDVPNGNARRVWRWHSEDGDNTCDECASRDGVVYESEDDIPEIPVHPNCRCSITEDVIAPDGKTISSKPYTPKKHADARSDDTAKEDLKEMTKDEKFEQAYNKLKEPEGGYTDGKSQVRDEPTNMGIKQSTLDNYVQKHPEKDFPADVKYLQPDQAKEIYKNMYWDNTKIPKIENDQVRNAVFDMNVMGAVGAGESVQKSLNTYSDARLKVDGVIGTNTIKALNAIPENKVDDFMRVLKEERMENLKNMRNWPTAKGGWTKRTMAYQFFDLYHVPSKVADMPQNALCESKLA